ncbi:MAG: hybrid sensor histidine kinase/response regulator [Candidatus Marinimicrobia bacterium]|nr:hybrid sensor histidine kinase/response regulator [Candidatus Neomarinimicrobiota bacterium]
MIEGLKVGATDYLTKPINPVDVILRSRNAVFMKQLIDQEKEHLTEMKNLQRLNDELNHMIVHDMRNPLTVMLGHLELLKIKVKNLENDKIDKTLSILNQQANRLIEMISSLLDINKFEKGEMKLNREEVDLIELLNHILQVFNYNKDHVKILLETKITTFKAPIDKYIIERVIENLLTNAIKFSNKNSIITLHIDQQNEKPVIKVIDQGPGIPAEYQEKIFEKFGQVESRRKGNKYSTGLGLTFCKYAVNAHGGEIGVYNNPNAGSTFWFTL